MKTLLILLMMYAGSTALSAVDSLNVKAEIFAEVAVIKEAQYMIDEIEKLKLKSKDQYTIQDLTTAQNDLLEEMNEHILYINTHSALKIKLIDEKARIQISSANYPL